jgi:pimeloyl-ACP methyl ester carboxylesterase
VKINGPEYVPVAAGELAIWERPGDGPAVLLCHATGFHARCWDQVTVRLPGRRSIAVDMRGHGRSFKPGPPYCWRRFGEDVAELCRALALRDAVGVGHSMGGHSVALAAALAPEVFSSLVLIDPVILPEEQYGRGPRAPHFARKRRNRWTSSQEMFERFADRDPFRRWDSAVLRDYCEYGLLPAPDGDGFVLACPPEIEASIYENSTASDANIYPEIARVAVPVQVIRAARMRSDSEGMDMMGSPTAPDLASRFRQGRDTQVQYSHFISMEAPAWIADQIAAAVQLRAEKACDHQ